MRDLAGIAIAAAIAGCGGGNHDYLAVPPAEAGQDLAQEICEHHECARIMVSCGGSPTATYFPYASEAECMMLTGESLTDLFRGCAGLQLTDEQRDTLNACFNADQGCVPEDELDDFAAAVCSGASIGPEACVRANSLLEACFACGQSPTDCGPV